MCIYTPSNMHSEMYRSKAGKKQLLSPTGVLTWEVTVAVNSSPDFH